MEEHAQEKVEALIRLFEEHGLEELLLEEGDFKLHLKRGSAAPAPMPPAPSPAPTQGPAPAVESQAEPIIANIQNTVAVRARR